MGQQKAIVYLNRMYFIDLRAGNRSERAIFYTRSKFMRGDFEFMRGDFE